MNRPCGRLKCGARVVDQYGDAGVSAQYLFNPSESRLVGQVGNDNLDGTAGVSGEACRQRLKPFSIAGDEDQIMTALCEPIGIDRADAGRMGCSRRPCRVIVGLVLPRPRVLPFSSLLRDSGVHALVSAHAQIVESSVRTGGSDTSAIAQLIAAAARQSSASATKNST